MNDDSCGPEVLFETCVAMKFVDDDDNDDDDDDDLISEFKLTQSVTKKDNRRSAVAVRQTETAFEKDHLGPYPGLHCGKAGLDKRKHARLLSGIGRCLNVKKNLLLRYQVTVRKFQLKLGLWLWLVSCFTVLRAGSGNT